MTRSTSLSGEHQEDLMAQGAQADQGGQTILTEDHQSLFPPLISFPSNPPEISDRPGYPLSSSTATEPELTPLSGNFTFT